jgi:hypothetical protein
VHAENLLRELGRPAEAERIEVAHAAQMKAEKGPSAWSMLLEGISEGLAQGPGIGRRNPTPTAPTPSAPQQPKQEVASTGSPAQSCTGWHNESSPHDVPYPPPCIPCNLPANGQGRPTATWDPILKKCVNSH